MQRLREYLSHKWFSDLHIDQQKLISLSLQLMEESQTSADKTDYSFVVFPAAKAYEGYLKQYLLDQGLVSKELIAGTRFRIGRSLNPDVNPNQRDQYWLYDNLVRVCGEELSRQLWNAWLECRNHLFHYFVGKELFISKDQAYQKLELLLSVMEDSWKCLDKNNI